MKNNNNFDMFMGDSLKQFTEFINNAINSGIDMKSINEEIHLQELEDLPTANDFKKLAHNNLTSIKIRAYTNDITDLVKYDIQQVAQQGNTKCYVEVVYNYSKTAIENKNYVNDLIDDLNYLGFDVFTDFEYSGGIMLVIDWSDC